MVVVDVLALAVTLLALGLAAGGYVAVLWSPFLLLDQFRPLFHVGPTGSSWLNYAIAAVTVGVVHVTAFALGRALLGSAVTVPGLVLYTGFGVATLWMAVAGVVLPAVGHDWKRSGYVTELVLLGGAVWYTLVTTVPLLFVVSAGLPG